MRQANFYFRSHSRWSFILRFVLTLVIGVFCIDQIFAASYTLGVTNRVESSAAGSDSVVLGAANELVPWTATNNVTWLHLSSASQTGNGSTNVIFSYDANLGTTRTGLLTIAGQTLTIIQAGFSYAQVGGATVLIASNLSQPEALAVDQSGNVLVADAGNGAIKKWITASNTVTNLVTGLGFPNTVAVDATGNVYFASNNVIREVLVSFYNSQITVYIASNNYTIGGLSVDSSNNVFFTDDSTVQEWFFSNQSVSTLPLRGSYPEATATDAAGNAYVSSDTPGQSAKYIAASNAFSTLPFPGPAVALAVDGSGNVYAVQFTSIVKWSAASNVITTLLTNLYGGLAVDGSGQLYFTSNNLVLELPYAFVDPTPKFEGSAAGSDLLPVVLPATANLNAPFAPVSSQSWLKIGGITNGVVSFSFTTNSGPTRTASITLLGQTIPVTQISTTAPTLFGVTILSNGLFQFAFSNNPSATFHVLSTTNLALPLASWTVAGLASNISPGLFQYTETNHTKPQQRFYIVRTP